MTTGNGTTTSKINELADAIYNEVSGADNREERRELTERIWNWLYDGMPEAQDCSIDELVSAWKEFDQPEETEEETESETNELWIRVKSGTENNLVGFLMLDGQYADGEYEAEENDDIWLVVQLGDRTDTTTAQEQFLNTNPNVIEYTIR